MKKLPEEVKIFDTVYPIQYFDSYEDVDPDKNSEDDLAGCYDPSTTTIRIWRGERSRTEIMKIILHEVIHIIGEKFNVEMLRSDSPKNDCFVDVLAMAFNTLLVDNPEVFNYETTVQTAIEEMTE